MDGTPRSARIGQRRAAGLAVGVAGSLVVTLLPRANDHTLLLPAMAYLLVVALSTATGRIVPGVAIAALDVGLLIVRDVQPLHAGGAGTSDDAAAVVAFALSAVIVSMLVDRIEGARATAERSVDRLARLQAVTAALSMADTSDDVTELIVAGTCQELGAERGSLLLLDSSGAHLHMVSGYGIEQEVVDRWHSFPVEANLPASEAVRTGDLVVLENMKERDRRYPSLVGLPPAGDHALAVVPLTLGDRPIGAMSLTFPTSRPFPVEDRRFLIAIAGQCAQALERARLHAAEQSALTRQTFIADATRLLSSSLDIEVTLAQVVRLVVPRVADSVSVHQFDGHDLSLLVEGNVDPDREAAMRKVSGRHANRSLDGRLLTTAATGEPLFMPAVPPSTWAAVAEDGDHLELLEQIGTTSSIIAPLWSRDRSIGVVSFGRHGDRDPFTGDDLALVLELAHRIAGALDNALAHRSRSEVAHTLQRSLLPPQPLAIPRLDVASRYHPVTESADVGGDFFDVFPAGESPRGARRWGIVMGDVCGKGVEAAALTALARYTVRAVAPQSSGPSVALHRLNRTVLDAEPGERFCTVAHVLLELDEDADGATVANMVLACGGHPLPLLLTADGTLRSVGRAGSAIGLFPSPELTDSFEVLRPGDALVLYTDGVTEARSPSGTFAPDLLEQTLAACAGLDAEGIVEQIEQAVIGLEAGRRRDDVALLVLRVPPLGGPVSGPVGGSSDLFVESYPPVPASVTLARRQLGAWLAADGSREAADILLAVSELASNAVRAARRSVRIRAWREADAVVLEVTDDGAGYDTASARHAPPDVLDERGRGLAIVASVMDRHTITSTVAGTTVRCRKTLLG